MTIIGLTNFFCVLPVEAVEAIELGGTNVLQASSTASPIGQNVAQMWNDIKAMETGTLGKSSINGNDGLDCHMVKNTEYGAALLLTISAYGVGSQGAFGTSSTNGNISGVSSTGNTSGIYQLCANWEWCSAYNTNGNNQYTEWFKRNVADKYVDKYTVDTLGAYDGAHKGDALFAQGFLGSTFANFVSSSNPFQIRGASSYGFFSYYYDVGSATNVRGRAVVVCGSGL